MPFGVSVKLSPEFPISSDIDECDLLTDNCTELCLNTIGGYNCSCADGYQLIDDGISCEG